MQAKVTGFVDKVLVDRGSIVKEGDLLATLVAPELRAQGPPRRPGSRKRCRRRPLRRRGSSVPRAPGRN